MAWWQGPEFRGHLDQVLAHLNEATATKASGATRTCELYFHALNKLWNAFAQYEQAPARADTPSLISLLRSMPVDARSSLLESAVLEQLVSLTPDVMDHSVLKSEGHRPGQEISSALMRDATEKHRKLRNAHADLLDGKPGSDSDRVLKKFAEFLYVVRSNIAHGEKTPSGPDLDKATRDGVVSALVLPVQELIIDLLLAKPSQKLVTYGTFRPGGSNENVLKELSGSWQSCSLHGKVLEEESLSYFRWQPHSSPIEAMLFTAPGLADAWELLDRFEGIRYQRQLVPAQTGEVWVVANVYVERAGSA